MLLAVPQLSISDLISFGKSLPAWATNPIATGFQKCFVLPGTFRSQYCFLTSYGSVAGYVSRVTQGQKSMHSLQTQFLNIENGTKNAVQILKGGLQNNLAPTTA